MKTIAVYNHSGGVGKTTTTRDLSAELRHLGYRVLVIDADPQSTLSYYFGFTPDKMNAEQVFWYDMAARNQNKPQTQSAYGIQVGISMTDQLLKDQRDIAMTRDEEILHDYLQMFEDEIDFALIDCPPGLIELTFQALAAADELLIPVQCESKSVFGLTTIFKEFQAVNRRRRHRAKLKISGLLPTLYDKTSAEHRRFLGELQQFGANILHCPVFSPIPFLRTVSTAGMAQMPLRDFRSSCPALKSLREVAVSLSKSE